MRVFYRATGVVALGILLAGCDNVDESIPTAPTPPTVTTSLTGGISINGAETKAFGVSAAGPVNATLTSVAIQVAEGEEPDPTPVTVGMALGTISLGGACTLVVTADSAVQGTSLPANVQGIGALCVRIYDTGRLTKPITYTVTVTHF
jgi:hypothetical protein